MLLNWPVWILFSDAIKVWLLRRTSGWFLHTSLRTEFRHYDQTKETTVIKPKKTWNKSILISCTYLCVLLWNWPKADNRTTVLHLNGVAHIDVVLQLNHFVRPRDVCHPVVGEEEDVDIILKALALWSEWQMLSPIWPPLILVEGHQK